MTTTQLALGYTSDHSDNDLLLVISALLFS